MAIIKKKFTYDMPDEYLAQTNDLGLTGEWEYEGPEKIYVFVDKETNIMIPHYSFRVHNDEFTQEEMNAEMKVVAGLDSNFAPVEFDKDPLLLAALVDDARLASDLPQKTYTLPGDTKPFYSRPDPIQPDHVISLIEIEWDPEKEEWKKPFPWRKPHITKDMFLSAHEAILAGLKDIPTSKFTSAQKTKWANYIAEFENTTVKFADYLDSPWMIPFPTDPRIDDKWDAEHDGLIHNTPDLEPSVPIEKVVPSGGVEYPEESSPGQTSSWRTYIAEMELTEEQKRTWTDEQLEAYVNEVRAGITT